MKRTTLAATAIVSAVALGLALVSPSAAKGPGCQGAYGSGSGQGSGMGMGQGSGMGNGMGRNGGQQMMGYGMGNGMGNGPGANPNCPWSQTSGDKQLTVADVTKIFKDRLALSANPNLKLGDVKEKDDKTITVTITTKDDSLVRQVDVDRDTGRHTPVR